MTGDISMRYIDEKQETYARVGLACRIPRRSSYRFLA
jgi:hypothetical protein